MDDRKKTGKNNHINRNKNNNKYIKEIVAKQAKELETKFEQKLASVSSVCFNHSSQHRDGASFFCSVQSGERRICSINRTNTTNVGESAAFELDSHADTSVLGKNFTVLEYTNTSCDVYGFSGTTKLSDVPGATAWNDENGTTFILVIHHALWMGSKLQHSPINSNQLRFNGVRVMDDPTQDGFSIYTKDIQMCGAISSSLYNDVFCHFSPSREKGSSTDHLIIDVGYFDRE